ncbi:uncharacterized protein PRCAT00001852001 [Priceomyces carsonii]|uniref:uncharacterized protein n=1 Tax=Priceomyces carsonii TaxID=28549 RepID=UPI002EDA2D86|nr:unnamed protein product [Priceomyces carsonii]
MSLLGLNKKKSGSSNSSGVSITSSAQCGGQSYTNFDEKKDYVRRCSLKRKCSGFNTSDKKKLGKNPSPVSFCLGPKC